jgi:CDP-glucose 4,6-dehydratase
MDIDFWKNKNILITGHTGFKGSWLSLYLSYLEANIYGVALEPLYKNDLFITAKVNNFINHNFCDIRDFDRLTKIINHTKPDIIFHLAAQPLVRDSYTNSKYTWETNVMGTINLLESIKSFEHKCAVVIVTTDKVYNNNGTKKLYIENDELGGFDPYSSSKSAVELAVNSWRNSFYKNNNFIKIATARAGNVIGGGDWSKDRIIPDVIKNLEINKTVVLRNPNYTRPWQHVLDPLQGYLTLAKELYTSQNQEIESAFNFGPTTNEIYTVLNLVNEIFKTWAGKFEIKNEFGSLHESSELSLAINKSNNLLKWQPIFNFQQAVFHTVDWYKRNSLNVNTYDITMEQIKIFSNLYKKANING